MNETPGDSDGEREALARRWKWLVLQGMNRARDESTFEFTFEDLPRRKVDPEGPKAAVKDVLARVHALLKPQGFRKKGQKFFRVMGVSTQWVDLQKDRYNVSDEPSKFTLNLAVTVHGMHPKSDSESLRYGDCNLQIRLGMHRAEPQGPWRDRWWRVGDPSDVEDVWNEIGPLIEGPGLEFLDSARTIAGLRMIVAKYGPEIPSGVSDWLRTQ